ncbi:MAG: ATP-binding protein [Myxococcota bacterium]
MGDISRFGDLIGVPAILFEADLSFAVVEVSPYWTELTGQSAQDALGHGWMKHLDGQSVTTSLSELEGALRRGEQVRYAVRCLRRDGQWCWLRVTARPCVTGRAAVCGVGMVVPEGEVHDEATKTRLEALERSEARADALLAASPDLLFHVSASGKFLDYRASNAQRLYVTPERFLGHTFEDVLPPEVARLSRQALERARLTGEMQHFFYELPGGEELRSFEARSAPMRGGDVLFVIRDVTDSKRNEAALVAAREEALERNQRKTQFLANVSHEIRTPLNGILGVTELLKQQTLTGELREYVDVLQGAGESLLAIVNDVLDLSKIEANRLELEPRVFDLEQVLNETVRTFVALAQRKGLSLGVEVEASARGPVRGDPARVRQIINNLVGNALKFTEQGSVRVSAVRDGERVTIGVADTGPGIAAEHQERIFEPFEQADFAIQRRYGGTGLGLAITRRIARLMGGDVSLESALGRGARFELDVPLPSVVITHRPSPTSRVTPAPRPLRVLLAEDDPVNAAMTAALVGRLGHRVSVVGNGAECVDTVKAGEVDLVLMDVHMPELDGLEATRLIREAEKGTRRHLPIVALTANAMKGDDLRCLSAGMDAYLAKPVTVAALKDLLLWFGSQEG